MAEAPLKQLGKYELTGVLGEGAMGVVYRAFDPVLNRFLAIKVMNSAIATDSALRERFLREARAAGSLQHPNVITIFDFGEVDGHLFIAMEFVDGSDLGEVIAHAELMPIPTRLDIIIDALNGLAYAHARGLVHRDIKPANIRVTGEHRAKLMDFGIARVESSELTQTGVMLGTPQYMSPEQVMGHPVTAASDVFSVGAVLYEFLSGVKPFHGETLHAVLFNVASENPRPIRELVPGLPAPMDAIVAKALAKEVTDRYADASAMAKDLAAVRLALTGSSESATVALTGVSADLRSHATTALRDPKLHSFIKRESGQMPVPKRPRPRWIAPTGIAAAATVAAVWFATRKPTAAPNPAVDGANLATVPAGTTTSAASAQQGAQPTVPPSQLAGAPSAAPSSPSAPMTGNAGATRGNTRATSPDRGTSSPATSPADARADSALQTLFAAASQARQRAQDAGVAAAALASGDSLVRAAQALAARGRGTEAAAQVSTALQRWNDAERAAAATAQQRGGSGGRASAPPATPAERTGAADPPVTQTATSGSSSPPVAAPLESIARPSADPRRAIESAIATYEQALESRDVNEVRRAYPGLTAAQQQSWEGFFKSVRNFKATLSPDQVQIDGAVANVAVAAVYEYENVTTGRADRQQLHLQATLNRVSGAWQIVSIR